MQPHPPGHFDREVCKPFYHKGNDCGILILHGFTGSCAQMRPLADHLATRGFTVRTINLPGHAATEEHMAQSNWHQWLMAAKEAAFQMRQEVRVLTVVGLSMGGVLALLLAQQMNVDACVTLSAPLAVKSKGLPYAGLAARFYPRVSWNPPTDRHKLINPEYDFGYSGFPTAKGADLYQLMQMAKRNLFNVHCPILVVQSDADETIWEGSAEAILDGVSSKARSKLELTGMPHVITLTPECPVIASAIQTLIQFTSTLQSQNN